MAPVIDGEEALPMVRITAPPVLPPADAQDVRQDQLVGELLSAETPPYASPHLQSTGVSLHEPTAVGTGDGWQAAVVRVQVTTPPGALDRQGREDLVLAATEAVAGAGESTQAGRTWIVLTEATEAGWRVARFASGRAKFAALRRE